MRRTAICSSALGLTSTAAALDVLAVALDVEACAGVCNGPACGAAAGVDEVLVVEAGGGI